MAPPSRSFVLCLDALLLVLFLLLSAPRMTGLGVHEWLGLALVPPMLLHTLLSWSWIAGVFRKLFTGAPPRSYVNFALNTALFVLVIIEVVSGVGISHVALPTFGVRAINDRSWRALHNLSLNWLHIVMGFHVAMNWQWIVATLQRWMKPPAAGSGGEDNGRFGVVAGFGRTLAILAAAAAVGVTIYVWLGPPSLARLYGQDEIARFAGSHGRGVGQFLGEAGLLALFAYAGRRWLRVRL